MKNIEDSLCKVLLVYTFYDRTYTLLVAGWILNTSGHVLMITTKEEKYKKYCIPVSYVSLALSGVAALLGLYAHRSSCCC
ncbi:hypothetical protein EB796_014274 [Bugula neritina]|uniref:Uncharacterized protein n=1 Tax=Bugula neritina TaxID=10212 RepID=A0A7J7JNF6_BUGNE|nr:hypothetical protein EB796_014274 [Bugula neritina]